VAATYPPPPGVPGGASLLALAAWATQARQVLASALQGRLNVTGELALANATETVLEDPRLSAQSVLHLDALTPEAAGLRWYALPEDRQTGRWVIRHDLLGAGRVVRYAILG
jgi:hypothetical protein